MSSTPQNRQNRPTNSSGSGGPASGSNPLLAPSSSAAGVSSFIMRQQHTSTNGHASTPGSQQPQQIQNQTYDFPRIKSAYDDSGSPPGSPPEPPQQLGGYSPPSDGGADFASPMALKGTRSYDPNAGGINHNNGDDILSPLATIPNGNGDVNHTFENYKNGTSDTTKNPNGAAAPRGKVATVLSPKAHLPFRKNSVVSPAEKGQDPNNHNSSGSEGAGSSSSRGSTDDSSDDSFSSSASSSYNKTSMKKSRHRAHGSGGGGNYHSPALSLALAMSPLSQSKVRRHEARGACIIRGLWLVVAAVMILGMTGLVMVTRDHSWAPAVLSAYNSHPRRMLMIGIQGVEGIKQTFIASYPELYSPVNHHNDGSEVLPDRTYFSNVLINHANDSRVCATSSSDLLAAQRQLLSQLDRDTVEAAHENQLLLLRKRVSNFAMRFISEMSPSVRTYLRPLGLGDTQLNGLGDIVRASFETDVDAPLVEFIGAAFADRGQDTPLTTTSSSTSTAKISRRQFTTSSTNQKVKSPAKPMISRRKVAAAPATNPRTPFGAASAAAVDSVDSLQNGDLAASSTIMLDPAIAASQNGAYISSAPLVVSPAPFRSLCTQTLRVKVQVSSSLSNFQNELENPISGYLMDQLVLSSGSCTYDTETRLILQRPDTLPISILNHALAFNLNVSDTLGNQSASISGMSDATPRKSTVYVKGRSNRYIQESLWSTARPGIISEYLTSPSASRNGISDVGHADAALRGYRGSHVRFATTIIDDTNVGIAAVVDRTSLMQQAGGSATYSSIIMAGSSGTSTMNPLELMWIPTHFVESSMATEDITTAPVWLLANNDLLQEGYTSGAMGATAVSSNLAATSVSGGVATMSKIKGLMPVYKAQGPFGTTSSSSSSSSTTESLSRDPSHNNFGSAQERTVSAAEIDVSQLYLLVHDVRKNWQYGTATWISFTAVIVLLMIVWLTEIYLWASRWILDRARLKAFSSQYPHISRKTQAAISARKLAAELAANASGIPAHIRTTANAASDVDEDEYPEGTTFIPDGRLSRDVLGKLLQLGTSDSTDLLPSSSDDEVVEARSGALQYADASSGDVAMRVGGRGRHGANGTLISEWGKVLSDVVSGTISRGRPYVTYDDGFRELQQHLLETKERSSLRREVGLKRLQKSLSDGAKNSTMARGAGGDFSFNGAANLDATATKLHSEHNRNYADGGEDPSQNEEDLLSVASSDRSVASEDFTESVITGRREIRSTYQSQSRIAITLYVALVGIVLLLGVGLAACIAVHNQQVSLGHFTEMFLRQEADAIVSGLSGTSLSPGSTELESQAVALSALKAQLSKTSGLSQAADLTIPPYLVDHAFAASVRAAFLNRLTGGRYTALPENINFPNGSPLDTTGAITSTSPFPFTLAGHTVSIIDAPEDALFLPPGSLRYENKHLSSGDRFASNPKNDAHAAVPFAALQYLLDQPLQHPTTVTHKNGGVDVTVASSLGRLSGASDTTGYRTIGGITQLDAIPHPSDKIGLLKDAGLVQGTFAGINYQEVGVTAYAGVLLPEHIFADASPVSYTSGDGRSRKRKALIIVGRAEMVLDGPAIVGILFGVIAVYVIIMVMLFKVFSFHLFAPFCAGSVAARCLAATGSISTSLLGGGSLAVSTASEAAFSVSSGIISYTASVLFKVHNIRFIFYAAVGCVLFTSVIGLGFYMESKLSHIRHETALRSSSMFAHSIAATAGYNQSGAMDRTLTHILPSMISIGPLYDTFLKTLRADLPPQPPSVSRNTVISNIQRRITNNIKDGVLRSSTEGAGDMTKHVSNFKRTVPSTLEFLIFERPTPTASLPSLARILDRKVVREEGAMGPAATIPEALTPVGRQRAAAAALGQQIITDDSSGAFASLGWTRGWARKWRLVPVNEDATRVGIRGVDDLIHDYFRARADEVISRIDTQCHLNSTEAITENITKAARFAATSFHSLFPSIYDDVPLSWIAVAEPMDNDETSGVLETRIVDIWSTTNARRFGTQEPTNAAQMALPKSVRDAKEAVTDDAALYVTEYYIDDNEAAAGAGLLSSLSASTSSGSVSDVYLVGSATVTDTSTSSTTSVESAGSTQSTFTHLLSSKATSLRSAEATYRYLPLPKTWEPFVRGAAWTVSRMAVSIPRVPAYFAPGFSLAANSTSVSFSSEAIVATAPIFWEPIPLSVGSAQTSTSSNLGSSIHYEVGTRGIVVQRFVGKIGTYDDHSSGGNTLASNTDGMAELAPSTITYILMIGVVSGCFAVAVGILEFLWRSIHYQHAALSSRNPLSYLGIRTADGIFKNRSRPSRYTAADSNKLDRDDQQQQLGVSGVGGQPMEEAGEQVSLFPPSPKASGSAQQQPSTSKERLTSTNVPERTTGSIRGRAPHPDVVCSEGPEGIPINSGRSISKLNKGAFVVAIVLLSTSVPLSALVGEWQMRSGALAQSSYEISWIATTVRDIVEDVVARQFSMTCNALLSAAEVVEETSLYLGQKSHPWKSVFQITPATDPLATESTQEILRLIFRSGIRGQLQQVVEVEHTDDIYASIPERIAFDALLAVVSTLHRRVDASLPFPTSWTLLVANTSDEEQFPTSDTWAAVYMGRSLLMETPKGNKTVTSVSPLTLSALLHDVYDKDTGAGKYGSKVRVPGLSWTPTHKRPSSTSSSTTAPTSKSVEKFATKGNRFPLSSGSSFTIPLNTHEMNRIRQREQSAIEGVVTLPELSAEEGGSILAATLQGGCRGCVFAGMQLHAGGLLSDLSDSGVGGVSASLSGGYISNASALLQHSWCPPLSALAEQQRAVTRRPAGGGRIVFGLLVGSRLISPTATGSRTDISSRAANGRSDNTESTPNAPGVQTDVVASDIGAVVSATWVILVLWMLLALYYALDFIYDHPDRQDGNGMSFAALAAEERRLKLALSSETLTGFDEVTAAAVAKSTLVQAALAHTSPPGDTNNHHLDVNGHPYSVRHRHQYINGSGVGGGASPISNGTRSVSSVARKLDGSPYAVEADEVQTKLFLQQTETAAASLSVPNAAFNTLQSRLNSLLVNYLPTFVLPTDWRYKYGAQLYEIGEPFSAINRFEVAGIHLPDTANFFTIANQVATEEHNAVEDMIEKRGGFKRAGQRFEKLMKKIRGKVSGGRGDDDDAFAGRLSSKNAPHFSDLERDRGIARIVAASAASRYACATFSSPGILSLTARRCSLITIITLPLILTLLCALVHIILAGALIRQRDLALAHQNHLAEITVQTTQENANSFEKNPRNMYFGALRGVSACAEALFTGSTDPLYVWQAGVPSRALSSVVFAQTIRRSAGDTTEGQSITSSLGSSAVISSDRKVSLLATLPKATRPFISNYRFLSEARKTMYSEICTNLSTLTQLAIAAVSETVVIASTTTTSSTTESATTTSTSELANSISANSGVEASSLICTDSEMVSASIYGIVGGLSSGALSQSLWTFQSVALLPVFSDADPTSGSTSAANFETATTRANAQEILPLVPDTNPTRQSASISFPFLATSTDSSSSPFVDATMAASDETSTTTAAAATITRSIKDMCATIGDCYYSLLRDFTLEQYDAESSPFFATVKEIKAAYLSYLTLVPTLRNEVPAIFATPRANSTNTTQGDDVDLDSSAETLVFNVTAHVLFLRRMSQIGDLVRRAQILDNMYMQCGMYPSLIQAPFAVAGRDSLVSAPNATFPDTIPISSYERIMAMYSAANLQIYSVNYTYDAKDAMGPDVFSEYYVPLIREAISNSSVLRGRLPNATLSSTGDLYSLAYNLLNAPTVGQSTTGNITALLEVALQTRRNETLFRTYPATTKDVATQYRAILANLSAINGTLSSPSPTIAPFDDTSLFSRVFAPIMASAARRAVRRIHAIVKDELLSKKDGATTTFLEMYVFKYRPSLNTTLAIEANAPSEDTTSLSATQLVIQAMVLSTEKLLRTIPKKAGCATLLASHQESIVPEYGVPFTGSTLIKAADPSSVTSSKATSNWARPVSFLDLTTASSLVGSAYFAPLHEDDAKTISIGQPLTLRHHILTNPHHISTDSAGNYRSPRRSQCTFSKGLSTFGDAGDAIASVNKALGNSSQTPISHQLWILQKRRLIALAQDCIESTLQLMQSPISTSETFLLNPLASITAEVASFRKDPIENNKGITIGNDGKTVKVHSKTLATASGEANSDTTISSQNLFSPFLLTTQFLRLEAAFRQVLQQVWLLEEAAAMRLSNIGTLLNTQHNVMPEVSLGSSNELNSDELYAEAWQRPRRFPDQGTAALPSSFTALPLATMRYLGVTVEERRHLLEAIHTISQTTTACCCVLLVVILAVAVAVHVGATNLALTVARENTEAAFFAEEDPSVFPHNTASYSVDTVAHIQEVQAEQQRKLLLQHPLLSKRGRAVFGSNATVISSSTIQSQQKQVGRKWRSVLHSIKRNEPSPAEQDAYIGRNAGLVLPNANGEGNITSPSSQQSHFPLLEMECTPKAYMLLYIGLLANRSSWWRANPPHSTSFSAKDNHHSGGGGGGPLDDDFIHTSDTVPLMGGVGGGGRGKRSHNNSPARPRFMSTDDSALEDADNQPDYVTAANQFAQSLQLPAINPLTPEQRHQCRYQGLQMLLDALCTIHRRQQIKTICVALVICCGFSMFTMGLTHWAIFDESASIEAGFLELDSVVTSSIALISRVRDDFNQLKPAHLRDMLFNLGELKSLKELRQSRIVDVNQDYVDQVVQGLILEVVGENVDQSSSIYRGLEEIISDDIFIYYLGSTGSVHPSACAIGRKRTLNHVRLAKLQSLVPNQTITNKSTSTEGRDSWFVSCPATMSSTHALQRRNKRIVTMYKILIEEELRQKGGVLGIVGRKMKAQAADFLTASEYVDAAEKLSASSFTPQGQPPSSQERITSIHSAVTSGLAQLTPALVSARDYEISQRKIHGESTADIASALLVPKYAKQLVVLELLYKKWKAVQDGVYRLEGQLRDEREEMARVVQFEETQRSALFELYSSVSWEEAQREFSQTLQFAQDFTGNVSTPENKTFERQTNVRQNDDMLQSGYGSNFVVQQEIRLQNFALGSIAKLFTDTFGRSPHLGKFYEHARAQNQRSNLSSLSPTPRASYTTLSDVTFFDPDALSTKRNLYASLTAYLTTSNSFLDEVLAQVIPITAPLHDAPDATKLTFDNPLVDFLNATLSSASRNVLLFSSDDNADFTSVPSIDNTSTSANATTATTPTSSSSSLGLWYATPEETNAQVTRLILLMKHLDTLSFPSDVEVYPWVMLGALSQTSTWSALDHTAFTKVLISSHTTSFLSKMLVPSLPLANNASAPPNSPWKANGQTIIDNYVPLLEWYEPTNRSSQRYIDTKNKAYQSALMIRRLLYKRYSPFTVNCLGSFTSQSLNLPQEAIHGGLAWFAFSGGQCPARLTVPRVAALPVSPPGFKTPLPQSGPPQSNTTQADREEAYDIQLQQQLESLYMMDMTTFYNLSSDVGRIYLNTKGAAAFPVGSSATAGLLFSTRIRSENNIRELYLRNREMRPSASWIDRWADGEYIPASIPIPVSVPPSTTTTTSTPNTTDSRTNILNEDCSPVTTADRHSQYTSQRRSFGELEMVSTEISTELERIKLLTLIFLDRPLVESPLLRGVLNSLSTLTSVGAEEFDEEVNRFTTSEDVSRASRAEARSAWGAGLGADNSPYALDILDRHSLVMQYLRLQLRNLALGGCTADCNHKAFSSTDIRIATNSWNARSVIQGNTLSAGALASLPPLFDISSSPTLEDVAPLRGLLERWPDAYEYLMRRVLQNENIEPLGILQQEGLGESSPVLGGATVSEQQKESRSRDLHEQVIKQVERDSSLRQFVDKIQLLAVLMPMAKEEHEAERAARVALRLHNANAQISQHETKEEDASNMKKALTASILAAMTSSTSTTSTAAQGTSTSTEAVATSPLSPSWMASITTSTKLYVLQLVYGPARPVEDLQDPRYSARVVQWLGILAMWCAGIIAIVIAQKSKLLW